ncbi:MAG: 4Fe-4S dicluster domain-containing protein [Caldivirga sp.]
MSTVTGPELAKYQRVVVDMDTCIGCGACISVCPYNALELNENGKARLIWDFCKDDFECIPVCPVNCIWKSGDAPAESKAKNDWYRITRQLTPEEQKIFEEWKSKYGVTGNPVAA